MPRNELGVLGDPVGLVLVERGPRKAEQPNLAVRGRPAAQRGDENLLDVVVLHLTKDSVS
jgi:hypothetical protein